LIISSGIRLIPVIEEMAPDDSWLSFTDSYILDHIRRAAVELAEPYGSFARDVLERKRPRVLYEKRFLLDKGSRALLESCAVLKRLAEKEPGKLAEIIGVPQEMIGFQELEVAIEALPVNLKASEIIKPSGHIPQEYLETVRVVKEDGGASLLVEEEGSIIGPLSEKKLRIFRLFYVEPSSGGRGR